MREAGVRGGRAIAGWFVLREAFWLGISEVDVMSLVVAEQP
jgi:hypothetical protein